MASPPKTNRPGRTVFLLVLVIFAASSLAALVQRSGGRVDVRAITLPTQDGQWLAADLFKPRSATKDDPAPLVIVVPGFQRSKETLGNIAIELSRRGIVVIAIDPYAQGNSSSSMQQRAATTEGYGMFAVVDYVHDTGNLNYVDKRRIAVTGHSAGGNAAIRGASHFGRLAKKAGIPSKLHAVFVSGYVLTLTDRVLRHVRSNVGVSYALYDEGAYRNHFGDGFVGSKSKWAAADMRFAPEALRLVASGSGDDSELNEVDLGRYYGDAAKRTVRVVYNERLIHPFQPYSSEATRNQLDFFERVFDLNWDRDGEFATDAQVWWWKELLTFLSLGCALAMLVPLARLLLLLPFFRVLVHELPPASPRPTGAGSVLFWSVFVVSGLIACATYIPFCYLSQDLFVAASTRQQTWFFPQRMNNAVMMWAVLNGVVGFVLFGLSYWSFGRRHGQHAGLWGTRTNFGELCRSFLLASVLFFAFFGLLSVVYYLFHVDYRFVFLGVRPFRPALLLLVPMYLPLFFVFFLANSLRVNGGMRFEGVPEWRGMLLAGVANTFGLALILLIQYSVFAVTGTVYWTDGWLYVNLLFAVVPIMFLLPGFHRLFFRMTGRIYLGPMTTCLVFVMILLTNTVCYLPL